LRQQESTDSEATMLNNYARIGVIDVGSNSVRLAVFDGGNQIFRRLITSRLGEGVECGRLSDAAIQRSADAVSELVRHAFFLGADAVYGFATEAVRRAENGRVFLRLVKEVCGLNIVLIKPEDEALLAVTGALQGGDGAVIDLGGASTEIAVKQGGRMIYAHSLNVGAVVLNSVCGRDKNKLAAYITQKTAEYGQVPASDRVVCVGGTATSITACALGLCEYDVKKVDGATVTMGQLFDLIDKFSAMSPEEIHAQYPVDGRRAEIIFGGAMLLAEAVKRLGARSFVASESDNLEGFYTLLIKGYFGDDPQPVVK